MRIVTSGAIVALFTVVVPAFAQAPAPKYVSIVGTVEKIENGAKTLAIKTDKGEVPVIKYDDRTQFLKLPAGEKDTKKATRAAAADVAPGDRVIARMRAEEDKAGLPAVFLYFEPNAELAELHKKTAEEWEKQSVSGTVKSVDAAAKRVVISVRAGAAAKDVTLDATGLVEYLRFSLDTGKYEPSTAGLTPIQTGDQVRVIGQKNGDQTEIKLEGIESGTFKSLPVTVRSVDTAAGLIAATDLTTKRPITISIKADTQLKRLDDQTALLMARRLNPTFQNDTGRGGRGGRGQGASPDAAGQPNAGVASFAGRGGGGQGGAGRGGRNADPNKLLDQQPTIELPDLKVGEPVVVTGSPSGDMAKLTATSVVAGVDPILRAAPEKGADPLAGNWNFGQLGGAE